MLVGLPVPVPKSVPLELRRDVRWVLSEEDGRIVSDYYGRRYELMFVATNKQQQEEWAAYRAEEEAGS